MGTFSIWHWLILLAVGLLFFGGKGRISEIMGDMGKGLKSFKKGMTDEEQEAKRANEAKEEDERRARDAKVIGNQTVSEPKATPKTTDGKTSERVT